MVTFKTLKAKICLLGDPSVGKTSLVQRFVFNFFGEVYVRTLGTKISRKVVHLEDQDAQLSCDLTLMIWDIMGQRTKAVPVASYFEGSNGGIILCDITSKATFQNIDYWLSSIRSASGDIPILLVANKIDLKDKYAFTIEEFKSFAKERGLPHFFTSAKTKDNVEEVFNEISRLILSNQLHPNFGRGPAATSSGGVEMTSAQDAYSTSEVSTPTPLVASTTGQQPHTAPPPLSSEPTVRSSSTVATQPQGPSIPTSPQDGGNQVPHQSQAPTPSPKTVLGRQFEIKSNNMYLVKEERPEQSFAIFQEYLSQNVSGLCISRTHPSKVESEYGIKDGKVLWLTTDSTGTDTIAPIVTKLNMVVIDFIQKNKSSVILLEGLEYLIHQNDFKTVLNLIHSINDKVMVNDCRMLIPLDPLVLDEKYIHQLTRDMQIISGHTDFIFS